MEVGIPVPWSREDWNAVARAAAAADADGRVSNRRGVDGVHEQVGEDLADLALQAMDTKVGVEIQDAVDAGDSSCVGRDRRRRAEGR